MFMLGSRGSPGVVEFETLVAEVGFAVSASLSGLQRLRRLTETTHDGYTAQAYCVPVPKGHTGDREIRENLKQFCKRKNKTARKEESLKINKLRRLIASEFALLSF